MRFMFKPRSIIDSRDEGELLEEKRRIISYEKTHLVSQLIAGIIFMVGALVGAITWMAMTCPGWEL